MKRTLTTILGERLLEEFDRLSRTNKVGIGYRTDRKVLLQNVKIGLMCSKKPDVGVWKLFQKRILKELMK